MSSPGQQQVRHGAGSFKNKGIGAGQKPLHGLEREIAHLCVTADLCKVGADEGDRLVTVPLLDPVDPLQSFLVENTAADPVGGVRRIGDDAAAFQEFHHLGLYNENLALAGIEHQMVTVLLKRGRRGIAISLDRDRRDFSERDQQESEPASPRRAAARRIEPPMRPAPTTAIRLNGAISKVEGATLMDKSD